MYVAHLAMYNMHLNQVLVNLWARLCNFTLKCTNALTRRHLVMTAAKPNPQSGSKDYGIDNSSPIKYSSGINRKWQ